MAFPTTSTLTTFTQADGALPGTWTGDIFGTGVGQVAVVSNQVAPGTFGRTAWWNSSSFGADSEVFATVAAKPVDGAGWLQLFARIQTPGSSAGDAYKVELGPVSGTDSLDVYRVINGVDTNIGTRTQEFTAGDRLGMEVTGTGATVTIRLYRYNGTTWAQVGADITDTNAARLVSAGFIGLGGYQTVDTMRIDDFGGGTVTGGGGSATVTAVVAASTGSAPVAAFASGATVTAVPAASVGSAPPANQILSMVLGAPAVVSLGSAPVASISTGGGGASVTAVPALSAGSAPVAALATGSTVTAVTAASVGSAPAASASQGITVTGVPALSSGQALRATLSPAPVGGGTNGDVAVTFSEAG